MFQHISFRDTCIGCNRCIDVCSTNAITIIHTTLHVGTADPYNYYKAVIDDGACIECDLCAPECPTGNILIDGMSPTGGGGIDPDDSNGGEDPNGGTNNNPADPPCKTMNNRSRAGSKFSKTLESLDKLLHLPIEKGFVNYNGPEVKDDRLRDLFYAMDSNENGESVYSPMLKDKNAFGYLHTHRDREQIASIHSFADLRAYIELVERRVKNNYSYDNTYGIVVGAQGIYSLNVTDISKFKLNEMTKREISSFWNNLYVQYDADWKLVSNDYYVETEKFMTNLLSKFYDKLGISLFKYDSQNRNWGKINKGKNANSSPTYDYGC